MSLKLLVDEDSQAKILVVLLRKAGQDVLTVNEANLSGEDDSVVFNFAISKSYPAPILTNEKIRNPDIPSPC